jgi:hypothetical protein
VVHHHFLKTAIIVITKLICIHFTKVSVSKKAFSVAEQPNLKPVLENRIWILQRLFFNSKQIFELMAERKIQKEKNKNKKHKKIA